MSNVYIAIDLKSFYASVECVERRLNPLTAHLVVADESRTDKTICLAVSPSLKAFGIPGRPRLFEVKEKLKEIKAATGKTIDLIVATPQMQKYIDVSANIYNIYLKYVSASDIHVYSIDEVFMDVTSYQSVYCNSDGTPMSPHDLAKTMILDVLSETGITATAGIGPNMYLAKIAMDIVAKHVDADKDGVRIAELDEVNYRKLLWEHQPLTSFWRIGNGIAKRLRDNAMYTMGDVAVMSLYNEDFLFRLFGVDAELLIDHAWGVEPVTMQDIKNYKPNSNSIGSGQVLSCPYSKEKARLVVHEMTDSLALDLFDKGLAANQIVLHIGYDKNSENYSGPLHINHFGQAVPKPAHGSVNLNVHTSSATELSAAALSLYDRIVNSKLSIHRLSVTFNNVIDESKADNYIQYDLFTTPEEIDRKERTAKRDRKIQKAILDIQKKYGKNAILKGMSFEDGATAIERNQQIGGHKA
ncbi:DNA methylase [Frisingicoccus sp.]|uniref:Y-family DNA polymerase n=1 Tax=Frisingicoccus sp. TaxID=1918627 RepID=UPI003AB71A2B